MTAKFRKKGYQPLPFSHQLGSAGLGHNDRKRKEINEILGLAPPKLRSKDRSKTTSDPAPMQIEGYLDWAGIRPRLHSRVIPCIISNAKQRWTIMVNGLPFVSLTDTKEAWGQARGLSRFQTHNIVQVVQA